MKIRVKHLETEIQVDDEAINDGRGLLYHNNAYSLQLLEKIVNEVIRLNENKGGNK
jgi:hypothetical protein